MFCCFQQDYFTLSFTHGAVKATLMYGPGS